MQRTSLARSAKDGDDAVERRKISMASLTESDNVFVPEYTLLPQIREIKSLKDVYDALQLHGIVGSIPNSDFRERFTSEDHCSKTNGGRFTAMTNLLAEAIEKIAGFFTPHGAKALINCTLDVRSNTCINQAKSYELVDSSIRTGCDKKY
jgi:hypothetical protein